MVINEIISFRDLTLVSLGPDEVLVIACDSLGGIGTKPHDKVKAPEELVGKYTVRVGLMEVLASGASPLVVVNTLCVEMNPTGNSILKGIQQEIEAAGLSADIAVTGSTEENMETCQSGLGVTVIGKAAKSALRLGQSRPGDLVICLGRPKVGEEVLDYTEKANPALVKTLLKLPYVREILPVGSLGVLHEAKLLAQCSGSRLETEPSPGIDLHQSAGPATCVLISVDAAYLKNIKKISSLPVFIIGRLFKLKDK